MKKTAIATVDLSDVKNPRIIMNNKDIFLDDLRFFGDGTRLKLTIEKYYKQRSLSQNGVLHWYLTELAEEVGMEMQDFKSIMGLKFLQRPKLDRNGEEIADENGEVLMYIPSTSDLDTAEMTVYIEKIRMFGLEVLNYELPLPDANYKIHFLENSKKQLKLEKNENQNF